jgi:hypothetical protein
MNAKEAVVAMDYAIGYALMRALFRTALQTVPAPVLAGTLEVPVETLVAFMEGGEPSGDLWQAGQRYREGREPPEMDPADIALNLLADTFPLAERIRARRALAEVVRPAMDRLQSEVAA